MVFKKSLVALSSVVLITAQFTGSAFGGVSDSTLGSPESKLLERVIALQGEDLSQGQLQDSIADAVFEYSKNAPEPGQEDRMEAAMVALQISTPSQAEAFVEQAEKILDQVKASATPAESANVVNIGFQQLLTTTNLAGAQYSSCVPVLGAFGGALAVGLILTDGHPSLNTTSGIQAAVGNTLIFGTIFGLASYFVFGGRC